MSKAKKDSSAVIKLKSPALAKALEEVKPKFETYKLGLDNITSDIRDLEVFLKSTGITKKFEMRLASYDFDPEIHTETPPSKIHNAPHLEFLSWQKYEPSGNYRLCKSAYLLNAAGTQYTLTSIKPLSETSASTRVRIFQYLVKFLTEFSSSLAIKEPTSSSPTTDFLAALASATAKSGK